MTEARKPLVRSLVAEQLDEHAKAVLLAEGAIEVLTMGRTITDKASLHNALEQLRDTGAALKSLGRSMRGLTEVY